MDRVIVALRTFLTLALPYFRSEDRWRARALLAGVIGAELGLVYVAVSVIQWNARFFNALEAKDWDGFKRELFLFGLITLGAIVSTACQYYFGQTLQIRWRRWLTERYVAIWMAEGRHYRIRFVDNTVDNIHLRIANDVLLFLQRTHELGTGLLNSVVALFSFAIILWGLSATTPLPIFGADLAFPGYLIWTALAYAGIGTLLAHLIGWRLIPLQFSQQRYESDFRFAIARVTDNAEPVALMGGEAVERAEMRTRFWRLVRNWTALVQRQTRLIAFTAGYGHISTVFPILVVSPAYLTGAITLGALIQAHLAFQRVEGAFAFCIGAYPKIAEWKAIVDRLAQFEAAMAVVDTLPRPARQHHDRADRRAAPCDRRSHGAARLGRADRHGAADRPCAGRRPAGQRAVRLRQVEPVPRARGSLAARRRRDQAARRRERHTDPGAAAAALLPARHAASGADLSDARGRRRGHGFARRDGRGRPRPPHSAARRGGRVGDHAVGRRAAARRIRARADRTAGGAAARRGRDHAGGDGRPRALPHAGRALAGHDRDLDRAAGAPVHVAPPGDCARWHTGLRTRQRANGRSAGLIHAALHAEGVALCRMAIWKFYLIGTGLSDKRHVRGAPGTATRC